MKKKEDYIVLGLGLTLMITVFVISYYAFQVSKPTEIGPDLTVPTNVPQTRPTTGVQTTEKSTNPPVLVNNQAQSRLLDKVNNRRPISTEDAFAKAKILAMIPGDQRSGILYETTNVRIDYVSSADLFQVEILTTRIDQAKAEASVWFRANGVSEQGICDYPVMFYLSWNTLNALRGSNTEFSPVGSGC